MLTSLLTVLLVLAVVGFIAWLIVTYIPMPDIFKNVIMVVIAICLIVWLISLFNGGSLHLPKIL